MLQWATAESNWSKSVLISDCEVFGVTVSRLFRSCWMKSMTI